MGREGWAELLRLLGSARHLEQEGYFDLARQLRIDARHLLDELVGGMLKGDTACCEALEESEPESNQPVAWLRRTTHPGMNLQSCNGMASLHWRSDDAGQDRRGV